jgi:hypothetical protein
MGIMHLTYHDEKRTKATGRPALEIENERLREAIAELILNVEGVAEQVDRLLDRARELETTIQSS